MRISTSRQKHDSQQKVLEEYVANHALQVTWYADTCTGTTTQRPAFERLQADIFRGRIGRVICYKFDRLSRRLAEGVTVLASWLDAGIGVTSVTQGIDCQGPTGRLTAHILLALAEWEHDLIVERVCDGLAAARARGVRLGRPPGTGHPLALASRKVNVPLARALRDQGTPVVAIARKFGCSRQAVHAALAQEVPARI
jgi:DNA invertase Pin-like site-specific DNA recombinase